MTVAFTLGSLLGVITLTPSSSFACPVTIAQATPFAVPSVPSPTRFWFGDESLAVLLSTNAAWHGMGSRNRYRDKLFWRRRGYHGATEQRPKLTVTGRRLDGEAPAARASRATNAHHPDFGGWAMLVMMEFPTAGCWEVTGEYRGEKLAFVVQVGGS
jgi:hypothetical protein